MVEDGQEKKFDENWPARRGDFDAQKYTLNRPNVLNDKFEKLFTNSFFGVEHIYHL